MKTGEQLAADASASLKEGLSFFNKILLGFAGGGAVRRARS